MTAIEGAPVRPLPAHAQKVFTGKIFEVWQWEQELYDETTAVFERIKRPDYAYVIGVLRDQRIMLVRDEQPDREAVLTPAGGKVEPGEAPQDAAAREFLEETGYAAETLVPWYSYRPSGKIEFVTHAFVGRNVTHTQAPELEGGERVEPVMYTFDEFLALGQDEELRDLRLRIKLLTAQIDSVARAALEEILYG